MLDAVLVVEAMLGVCGGSEEVVEGVVEPICGVVDVEEEMGGLGLVGVARFIASGSGSGSGCVFG